MVLIWKGMMVVDESIKQSKYVTQTVFGSDFQIECSIYCASTIIEPEKGHNIYNGGCRLQKQNILPNNSPLNGKSTGHRYTWKRVALYIQDRMKPKIRIIYSQSNAAQWPTCECQKKFPNETNLKDPEANSQWLSFGFSSKF